MAHGSPPRWAGGTRYPFRGEAGSGARAHARRVYRKLAADLIARGTTRVAMFSTLHADATLILMEELERAVLNVISNGADYCPDEGTLVIRAEEERQQESCFLKITVTDSGPGFAEEALLHETEQFYQADKSRKGTAHYGMGLYITSTLLQKHGGRLELGNSKDAGGMVVIHFPMTA